ncbi:hypothetical protein [Actinomyces mediterranea]|uniref:hypothetical protein n=1 Tax=Actinomyces mediterranea TaxID=1871028 RepID=UPI0038B28553
MLEAGEIPFEKARRHRRLFLVDVIEYRKRQRALRGSPQSPASSSGLGWDHD